MTSVVDYNMRIEYLILLRDCYQNIGGGYAKTICILKHHPNIKPKLNQNSKAATPKNLT